jgi:hypothetical protein
VPFTGTTKIHNGRKLKSAVNNARPSEGVSLFGYVGGLGLLDFGVFVARPCNI